MGTIIHPKYKIYLAYIDELYGQPSKDTEFFLYTNIHNDLFETLEEAKAVFDKIVRVNEELIQKNCVNTFHTIILMERKNTKDKVIEKRVYE